MSEDPRATKNGTGVPANGSLRLFFWKRLPVYRHSYIHENMSHLMVESDWVSRVLVAVHKTSVNCTRVLDQHHTLSLLFKMKLSRNRYKNRELIQSSTTDDHISIRILVREFAAAAVTFES